MSHSISVRNDARLKPQYRLAEEKGLETWCHFQSRALCASVVNSPKEGLSHREACEGRLRLSHGELKIPVCAARILALRFLTEEVWCAGRSDNLGNHSAQKLTKVLFDLHHQVKVFPVFQGFSQCGFNSPTSNSKTHPLHKPRGAPIPCQVLWKSI